MKHSHDQIIGASQAIQFVLNQAKQVAVQDTPALILGETGTGKELLAHAIHNMSSRKDRPMVIVNCASLASTLIESELFGREKGAYTGALTKQVGRFEVADESTIFLDEIGDLSLGMQAKFLRVLQEGQFERLGSHRTITVDVRTIAATNHDLEEAVRGGRFRKDLFYRLSVFPITVPPLRERTEDIPMLVWAFVKEFSKKMGKSIEKIPEKSMKSLQEYSWPGNVRELRNIVERAMIVTKGSTLHIEPLPNNVFEVAQDMRLKSIERQHILKVLKMTNWRISGEKGAAKILDMNPKTLESRMKKLGLYWKAFDS